MSLSLQFKKDTVFVFRFSYEPVVFAIAVVVFAIAVAVAIVMLVVVVVVADGVVARVVNRDKMYIEMYKHNYFSRSFTLKGNKLFARHKEVWPQVPHSIA